MNESNLSVISLSMHQGNYEKYFDKSFDTPPETDTSSTFHSNSRHSSSSNPRVTNLFRSSLLNQIEKIREADSNFEKSFRLTHLSKEENRRLYDLPANYASRCRDIRDTEYPRTNTSELDAIDREIALLRMKIPSFNLAPDVSTCVSAVSTVATGIQIAGIIGDGVVESIETGFSAVCALTPQSQRTCDGVVSQVSSLALASTEFAKKHWEGSSAQNVYNSAAESLGSKWQKYVEASNQIMMGEGLTPLQIKKYNRDLATIGRGAETIILSSVGANAVTATVTSVKKSMQLLKAKALSNQFGSTRLYQTVDFFTQSGIEAIGDVRQSIMVMKEHMAITREISISLTPKFRISFLEKPSKNYFPHRATVDRTKRVLKTVGIRFSEYLKYREPFMPLGYHLDGRFTLKENVLKLTVDSIDLPEKPLYHWLDVMQNLKRIAKDNNASILRFEVQTTNEKLLAIMIKNYGKPFIVEKKRFFETQKFQSFDIPIMTAEMRFIRRMQNVK